MNDTVNVEQTRRAEELAPHQCWALLRGTELGRLALVLEGHPEIFPITYLVDHGAVVFRTAPGSKLSAIHAQGAEQLVAFEADGVEGEVAWSVVIKGRAKEVTGLYDAIHSALLPLHPHQGGQKDHLVEVMPGEITGRRFSVDQARWATPLTGQRQAAPE
jgi:nitroimidazol reductase NimA-like FMN-containing flavoprotein (pyridoxamine 5'-phosphate oxidase superfamily)